VSDEVPARAPGTASASSQKTWCNARHAVRIFWSIQREWGGGCGPREPHSSSQAPPRALTALGASSGRTHTGFAGCDPLSSPGGSSSPHQTLAGMWFFPLLLSPALFQDGPGGHQPIPYMLTPNPCLSPLPDPSRNVPKPLRL